MCKAETKSIFWAFVEKAEFRLILAWAYAISLACAFVLGCLRHGGWIVFMVGHVRFALPAPLIGLLVVHALFMVLATGIYFLKELITSFCSPVLLVALPLSHLNARRYLNAFRQNQPAEVVVILEYPNWFTLEGWLKPIFFKSELKRLVEYLTKKGQTFSFYTNASREDIDAIMSDRIVKEVYFFGHGVSHGFELSTGEMLYYCEFDDPKYGKAFVHQVHCGTPYGKSLIDYVVPPENRGRCFFFRKPINGWQIVREFKNRTAKLEGGGETCSGPNRR